MGGARDVTSALAAALVVATVVAVALVRGRSLWFAADDWNVITGYPSGHLLEPFNGHLSLVPVGAYQVLFHTVGLDGYLPYRLLGLAAVALLGWSLVRHGRSWLGPWAAVLLVAAVLLNGLGATPLLFPFLCNFTLPLAALVAMWWHLDAGTRRGDLAAGAWLALALACSGLGVVVLAVAVVELAVSRAGWRRWALVLPGGVLWAAWWLTHRDATAVSSDAGRVSRFAWGLLVDGGASVVGGVRPAGVGLLAALVGLAVVCAARWRAFDARAAGAVAAPLCFVALTALTRAELRAAPRYGWMTAALLLLAATALWRPDRADRERLRSLRVPAVAAAVLAVGASAVVLWQGASDWVDGITGDAPGVRTNLFATEAAGPRRVDRDIVLPLSIEPVTTGDYLDAVAQLGSPLAGRTAADFGGRPDQLRGADDILRRSLRFRVVPSTGPVPAGCATEAVVPPGGEAAAPPGTGALDVLRFGPDPVTSAAPDGVQPAPAVRLLVPADAPTAASWDPPYRIVARGGVVCGGG